MLRGAVMGFDIHGKNPSTKEEEPILPTLPSGREGGAWTEQDRENYNLHSDWESRSGVYFRNNVWYWRPLWELLSDEDDILSEKDIEGGNYNNGHFISKAKCIKLAKRLRELDTEGTLAEIEKTSREQLESDPTGLNYPFTAKNARNFQQFLQNCGGCYIS